MVHHGSRLWMMGQGGDGDEASTVGERSANEAENTLRQPHALSHTCCFERARLARDSAALNALLKALRNDQAVHKDTRDVHVVRINGSHWDDLFYLCDCELGCLGHRSIEVAC
jgi:hypothetical protein